MIYNDDDELQLIIMLIVDDTDESSSKTSGHLVSDIFWVGHNGKQKADAVVCQN